MALLCRYNVSPVRRQFLFSLIVLVVDKRGNFRLIWQYMIWIQEIKLNFIGLLPISQVFRGVFPVSV
jgi:hypothetical protein